MLLIPMCCAPHGGVNVQSQENLFPFLLFWRFSEMAKV